MGKRLLFYPLLLLGLAALVHFWITQPQFWKNLPYRFQAIQLAFTQVKCDQNSPAGLAGLLKYHALPNFSHTAQVFYVDESGQRGGCKVSPGGEEGSHFRLASATKAVTAHAILALSSEGKLGLNDPVLNYFPEIDQNALRDARLQHVTLAMLLNHSSGFGGLFGSDNMVNRGEVPWCPYNFQMMEMIYLAGMPGTNHVYSNVAYCLLGEVISRVSGMPYREYVGEHYLAGYSELDFLNGGYLPSEPEYNFSNDFNLGPTYVEWLDLFALSSATGLIGPPADFADMVWQHLHVDAAQMLSGPLVNNCGGEIIEYCYSWNFELLFDEQDEVIAGVQQGYMPGVSTLLALTPDGQVLVWVAAGAPILGRHREQLKVAVGRFLQRKS